MRRRITGQLSRALRRPLWALKNLRLRLFTSPSECSHVFVLGPPRSGTTLVENIIRSHPAFAGIDRETNFFLRYNYLDLQFDEIENGQMQAMVEDARDHVHLFDLIAAHVKNDVDARYFVEKTPEHALVLPMLVKHYPNSRFVFVVRDVRDGYLSAQRITEFWAQDLTTYCRLWADCVRRLQSTDTSNVLVVRYESLVEDPVRIAKKIMRFVGVSFYEQQLHPDQYGSTSRSKVEGLTRLNAPITAQTVGEWKSALPPQDLNRIVDIAGEEMEWLSYH